MPTTQVSITELRTNFSLSNRELINYLLGQEKIFPEYSKTFLVLDNNFLVKVDQQLRRFITRDKLMTHEIYINHTIELARSARRKGNHPFGATLVHNGKIVLSAENSVVSSGDITRHAELSLISKACDELSSAQRKECILYTSTEPCAMCTGSIYWSGIRTVVFGLPAKELGQFTTGSFIIECSSIFQYGTEETKVIGPINLESARDVHANFW